MDDTKVERDGDAATDRHCFSLLRSVRFLPVAFLLPRLGKARLVEFTFCAGRHSKAASNQPELAVSKPSLPRICSWDRKKPHLSLIQVQPLLTHSLTPSLLSLFQFVLHTPVQRQAAWYRDSPREEGRRATDGPREGRGFLGPRIRFCPLLEQTSLFMPARRARFDLKTSRLPHPAATTAPAVQPP